MTTKTNDEPRMTSKATYSIKINGKLCEDWAAWFNGTHIAIESSAKGNTDTTLLCCVQDQSELLGILNRLNSLNLPLLQVVFVHENK